jgi:Carboxypeptidase regulatory-like domain
MNKRYSLLLPLLLVSILFFYNSCKDNSTNPTNNNGGETVSTTISGTVLDESNTPIVGANVSSAGQTAVTNNSGGFTFSGIQVPKDRFVVNVTKSGYLKGSYADSPVANGSSTIKVYLMTPGTQQTVSSTSGGEVALQNGSKVMLNANSVASSDGSTYTGNVNVSVGYLDPTSENFSAVVPGGDMQAQRSDNSSATLYSYGIIKVQMKDDSGNDLNLKSGSNSEITVDIPQSMQTSAPATIPLWHYDETTGLWMEEGTATKQGDKYVGTVSHFSDWNCDVPEGTATVSGLVLDCNSNPVPGISVQIGQVSVITGADGTFSRRVPANTAFDVQVTGSRNFGLVSTPVHVDALTEGTTHDVGTLNVDCPVYVKGLIKCGTDIKYGQVTISWDGGYNTQFTEGDGSFKLATDVGKNADVSIYTVDGNFTSMTITTPTVRGQVLDLGTIEVCSQVQTGDNKVTIDGSGFSNKTFAFTTDTTQVFGYFDPTDSLTWIWMGQFFAPDTILFYLTFNGVGTGSQSNVGEYFFHNSQYYYGADGFPNTTVSLNVANYGGIGGLIEGTFGGTLINLVGGTTSNVTISNGQFSVVRLIAQKPIMKKHLADIPKSLRKIMHLK